MDAVFWHTKWEQNQIGFHSPVPHPFLVSYFARLNLKPGAHVLVPLCGKTLDIHWLLAAGCRVTGIELSPVAVEALFQDLGLVPQIETVPNAICYTAGTLRVFVGDIFECTPQSIGRVDAVYDRAALIALPEAVRASYAQHLICLAQNAPQLLTCVEYDQSKRAGPPFAVLAHEVSALYGAAYRVAELEKTLLPEGIKGLCPAYETVWYLSPKGG